MVPKRNFFWLAKIQIILFDFAWTEKSTFSGQILFRALSIAKQIFLDIKLFVTGSLNSDPPDHVSLKIFKIPPIFLRLNQAYHFLLISYFSPLQHPKSGIVIVRSEKFITHTHVHIRDGETWKSNSSYLSDCMDRQAQWYCIHPFFPLSLFRSLLELHCQSISL